jgi:hypothetical protein
MYNINKGDRSQCSHSATWSGPDSDGIYTKTLLSHSRDLKELCKGNIRKQIECREGEALIIVFKRFEKICSVGFISCKIPKFSDLRLHHQLIIF